MVSQVLAERYFPGDDPLGRRFKLAEDGEWITVVGIVGDVVYDWFANRRNPTVYVPLAQDPTLRLAFAARTAGNARGADARACGRPWRPPTPTSRCSPCATMERVVTERVAGVDYFAKVLTVMSGARAGAGVDRDVQPDGLPGGAQHQGSGAALALGATTPAGHLARRIARGANHRRRAASSAPRWRSRSGSSCSRRCSAWSSPSMLAGVVAVVAGAVTMAAGYVPARRAAGQDPWVALRTE